MRLPVTLAAAALLPLLAATYADDIRAWQKQRETGLRADTGWLTVAGLFWLKDGANPFGTAADNAIVLPAGSAEAHAGQFELRAGKVFAVTGGQTRELKPNSSDSVALGSRITMFVLDRGGRLAIRMRDKESSMRREFHGLKYFPIREEYRLQAKFTAQPHQIPIANVVGITQPMESPGYVTFTIKGKEYRLEPVFEEPGATELFYIFRDATASRETYGAGRFVYSALPQNGTVVLDFNKAYNPPCAFTAYATCPLPPRQNRLDVRIEAGELRY